MISHSTWFRKYRTYTNCDCIGWNSSPRDSHVSSADVNYWRPQIWRRSRVANSCDTMADNRGHALISTGKMEALHKTTELPQSW